MDLTDRTALVTGANRGIGRALCEALAARPLRLVLAGVRDPDAFEPIAGRAEVRPVRMDLSSRESIDAVRRRAATTRRRRPARQQRRPDDRRAARGAGHGRGLRDVPGQPRRGRPPDQPRAPAHARPRARHGGQQRLDQRLRLLPRRQHLRGVEGGRRRAHRVAAARARRHRRRAPCTSSRPGVEHRHARRDRGGLRPPHGHLGLGQGRAGGVGGEGARRRRGGQVDRRPRRAPVAYAKLASRGPAFLLDAISGRMFSRQPRH